MNPHSRFLLGVEAVAQAAIDAGILVASGYPGTPSTEALEYIQSLSNSAGISSFWSANEKNAYGVAMGASYNGRRAFCSMKHVGLNDCFDYFMSSALSGVHGGLVLLVADDQGMASSQSEQDTRPLAQAANIPCFEPSNHQEAYDMTRKAFEFSEKYRTPVIVRVTAKLAHGRASIETFESQAQTNLGLAKEGFMLLPMYSRVQYPKLLEDKWPALVRESEENYCGYVLSCGEKKNTGRDKLLISSGIGYNYLQELLGDDEMCWSGYNSLRIGMPVPFPVERIEYILREYIPREIYVFEDGSPFIERTIKNIVRRSLIKVIGRESGHLSLTGNLQIEEMRSVLGLESIVTLSTSKVIASIADIAIGPRLPKFCRGCPHEEFFKVLDAARKQVDAHRIYGDIGCYFLGHFPPYQAMDTLIAMGASISMGMGAVRAGAKNVLSIIGDSTLCHSGLPAIREAAYHNSPMTIVIMDNGAVAMTGAQDSYLTGESLYQAILGLGVKAERVKQIRARPSDAEKNSQTLVEEIKTPELSVIISQGSCVKKARMLQREKR